MTLELPRPPAPSTPLPRRPTGSQRALDWLGSTKNVAGCLAGALGVVLTAVGLLVPPYWPFAVVALYGAGALAAPGRRPTLANPPAVDVAVLHRCLDAQLKALTGNVPTEVFDAAQRVADALVELLDRPHLLRPGAPETFVVTRAVADYLPTPLEVYANLPRYYADHHQLDDGRTPREVVIAQLALLERGIRNVITAAASGDTTRLLAHGRYLDSTFGGSSLDEDAGP